MNIHYRLIVFLLFTVLSIQAQSFKCSQEEELEHDLQHWQNKYPERTKEDIYDELKTLFASNMYQVEPINSLIARLEN